MDNRFSSGSNNWPVNGWPIPKPPPPIQGPVVYGPSPNKRSSYYY